MTLYEFLKFIHVLAAIVWVGGGVVLQVLALRATMSKDPARLASFSGDAEWVGMRVFMPSSLVLIGFGVWATAEGNWDWGAPWISIGFAAVIVSFFVGMGFLGPESGRIKTLVTERGIADPEVGRRIRRVLLVSRLELLLLLVAVWAMVVKPG